MIKVRKVLYTPRGYIRGEYLGEFPGDITTVYDKFAAQWMRESSADGELSNAVSKDAVNYADEFTFCSEFQFSVGVKDGVLYEGIATRYRPAPGTKCDEHGFEVMKDTDGNKIKYTSFADEVEKVEK